MSSQWLNTHVVSNAWEKKCAIALKETTARRKITLKENTFEDGRITKANIYVARFERNTLYVCVLYGLWVPSGSWSNSRDKRGEEPLVKSTKLSTVRKLVRLFRLRDYSGKFIQTWLYLLSESRRIGKSIAARYHRTCTLLIYVTRLFFFVRRTRFHEQCFETYVSFRDWFSTGSRVIYFPRSRYAFRKRDRTV